jgi:hypothetical protein
MKIFGFFLIIAVWVLPITMFILFPADQHGVTEFNQIFYSVRDFTIMPGILIGAWIDSLTNPRPLEGASFVAYVAGIVTWLSFLSIIIFYFLCRRRS